MNLETSSIDVGIVTLLDNYFELMHAQDMNLFDKVFHESCSLFGVPDGALNIRSFAVYKEAMQNRQSPAEKGEARRDEILFVDQLNDSLALARVQLEMMGGVMQDYLSLLKIDGQWLIVAKTWARVGDAKP
ncbi:MAG: nuclear transport factor 2 family protein [Rhodoluna sp.]|nr:nuclear transport factor 2 family protein [Rhodoluna sp.]